MDDDLVNVGAWGVMHGVWDCLPDGVDDSTIVDLGSIVDAALGLGDGVLTSSK